MLDPELRNESGYNRGTCHRCGWKGPIVKVDRRTRRQLQTGREFGRLCDSCMVDLMRSQVAVSARIKPGKPKLTKNRHVA